MIARPSLRQSRSPLPALLALALAACGGRTGLSLYTAAASGASDASAGTPSGNGASSGGTVASSGASGSATGTGATGSSSTGTPSGVASGGTSGSGTIAVVADASSQSGSGYARCGCETCPNPDDTCPLIGETYCKGCCVDLQSDPGNCGACGHLCSGDETCQAGSCGCPQGEIQCGYACVDARIDTGNCGACEIVCPMGSSCQDGACGACPSGETACGNACVNEEADPANCGACGVACQNGTICTAGDCACPADEILCGSGALASCTDVLTATNNCGGCGVTCSAGQVCESGVCVANPPSCAPGGAGMTNCGPGGSGTESCCTSLEVAGGSFFREYVSTGLGPPTGEGAPATVTTLRLDKYLVTVGRFRQFVQAVLPPGGGPGWLPAPGSGKHTHLNAGVGLIDVGAPAGPAPTYEPGWVTSDDVYVAPTDGNLGSCSPYASWTSSASHQENLPINCVTWQEAYAFCIWDGGFLPSAAEWEYVAAGGSQQREYPWGSGGDSPQYAITGSGDPCDGESGCSNYPGGTCTVADIAPVGYAQLGAGLWGQLDLAGDAWQWTLDRYDAYVTPCLDCALITSGDPAATSRIIHGGSFTDALQFAQPPALFWELPTMRSYCTGDIGFRCARPPE